MPRYLTPAALIFGLCLLASFAIHVPIYGALGVLGWLLKVEQPAVPSAPVEIEFEAATPDEPMVDAVEPQAPEETPADDPPARPERRREERPRVAERETPAAQPETPPPPPVVPPPEAPPQPPQPPPPNMENPQAVTQHATNETAPNHARFIAEHNNTVEEESVAQLRNYQEDAPQPSAGAPRESASQDEGNAEEQDVADMRDMEGSEQRTATEEEARAERPRQASERLATQTARGNTANEGEAQRAQGTSTAAAGDNAGARASGGGAHAELRTIQDANGSFTISVPTRAEGEGAGEEGGAERAGAGLASAGAGRQAGRAGDGRHGERGRGRGTGAQGADLRVSWAAFEETVGEQQLEREREAYAEERRTKNRGGSRAGAQWTEFRAAIENFVPNVRPGNQTALNAAASPFAEYLSKMHRRIHRQFAERFLPGLPGGSMSPFADPTLMTNLEIIMNRDGTVHRIGVVTTSGFLPFDYGAYNSVMRGQPYAEAPASILSGDGRVYVHWAFYRNERQCGTFNAEPYILNNPPASSAPTGPRDEPEWGGVVPRGATPTWGTDGEHRGEDTDGEGQTPSAPRPAPEQQPGAEPPPRRNEPVIPVGGGVVG